MSGDPKMPTHEEDPKLTLINAKLAELGSTAKYKMAPENREGFAPLKGRRVIMVDDTKDLLEAYIPDLMVATGGAGDFVRVKPIQTVQQAAEAIMAKNPEVILMDYHISPDYKGTSIAQELQQRGFTDTIIGFSSEKDAVRAFEELGIQSVEKSYRNPSKSLEEVGKFIL